jgi:ubiquinone/menaquinone biosynthesis C-methylase UbiE
VEEAADLIPRLRERLGPGRPTVLELGSGGGSLASHLTRDFEMTLTDRSAGMLAVSRSVNPQCEHVQGDMAVAFAISNGTGIPIPRTTRTSWITRF